MKNQITVSNRNNWNEIYAFFNEKMNQFELFFADYDEVIKDI